jgi:hypothetical protein
MNTYEKEFIYTIAASVICMFANLLLAAINLHSVYGLFHLCGVFFCAFILRFLWILSPLVGDEDFDYETVQNSVPAFIHKSVIKTETTENITMNLKCGVCKETIPYSFPPSLIKSGNCIEWKCIKCTGKNYLDIQ